MAELLYFPRPISSPNQKLGDIAERLPELIARLEWCHEQLTRVIGDCDEGTAKHSLTEHSASVRRLIDLARAKAGRIVQAIP